MLNVKSSTKITSSTIFRSTDELETGQYSGLKLRTGQDSGLFLGWYVNKIPIYC